MENEELCPFCAREMRCHSGARSCLESRLAVPVVEPVEEAPVSAPAALIAERAVDAREKLIGNQKARAGESSLAERIGLCVACGVLHPNGCPRNKH
jgi:hypothetical protein